MRGIYNWAMFILCRWNHRGASHDEPRKDSLDRVDLGWLVSLPVKPACKRIGSQTKEIPQLCVSSHHYYQINRVTGHHHLIVFMHDLEIIFVQKIVRSNRFL
jgi:hypothetical protein